MTEADPGTDQSHSGIDLPARRYSSVAPPRFAVFRDRDGRRHAVSRNAVSALSESEDGATILLLPGGRIILVEAGLEDMIAMFG